MKVDSAKLQKALQRIGSPRAVLARLGIDSDLVAPSGGNDPAMALRLALEAVLGDTDLDLDERAIAKILAILDSHAPLGAVDPADENAAKAKALAGDDREKFRALLLGSGLTEAEVDEAERLANGKGLPKNALNGGYGGALAADRAMSAFSDRHPEAARIGGVETPYRPRRALAQDAKSTAGAMSFAERHPDVARVF